MPKISIVIPAYNAAHTIAETLDSVLQQTYSDFEIILVDDGSSDSTQTIIQKYLPQIIYVRQENRGPAAARNHGIRISSGEYLIFLDADDLLLPKKLEIQVSFLLLHPEIDVVYSDGYLSVMEPSGHVCKVLFSKVGMLNPGLGSPEQSVPLFLKRNALLMHCALVRKSSIVRIGGFDENMDSMEDWDLWYRLSWMGKFYYQSTPTVIYEPTVRSLTRNGEGMLHNSIYMEHKVEQSRNFRSLGGKTQSSFFFGLGLSALKLDDIEMARQRFWKALYRNPANLLAGLAWLYILLLPSSVCVKLFHFLHRRLTTRGRLGL